MTTPPLTGSVAEQPRSRNDLWVARMTARILSWLLGCFHCSKPSFLRSLGHGKQYHGATCPNRSDGPSNSRDTPHLDRDGDRWRGRPSEARLAVTDDGPRSESRSSGGWQGGPSGADIDRAIAIIEDSRQTHVNWADWRRKGNGTDTDHEMIGDLEWHENAIRDYDHVLTVLRRVTPEKPGVAA